MLLRALVGRRQLNSRPSEYMTSSASWVWRCLMRPLPLFSSLSDDELEASLVRGTAEQSSYLAWWLSMLVEFDRRELWATAGFPSCVAWLMSRCGSSGRAARDQLAVARRLEEVPLTRAAFAEGRLSYSKVRALTRVADAGNEAMLLELTQGLTASQLERHVRAYEASRRAATRTPEARQALDDRCGITSWTDGDGLVHFEVVLPPEEAIVFERATEYGKELQHRKHREEDRAARAEGRPLVEREKRSVAWRRLDGLLVALRRGLANAERDPTPVDDPFLIVFHVRQGEAFVNEAGELDLGNGFTVPSHLVKAMGCSSMVQTMLVDDHDRPLDLGRRARVASPKQKVALGAMFQGCEFPGCDVPIRWCQMHHVEWWGRDEGRTDLANLRPLCRRHHGLVHRDGWRLALEPSGARLVAISPTGRRVTHAAPLTDEAVAAEAVVARLDELGLRDGIDDQDRFASIAGRWGGERMTAWARAEIGSAIANACDVPELLGENDALVTARGAPPIRS